MQIKDVALECPAEPQIDSSVDLSPYPSKPFEPVLPTLKESFQVKRLEALNELHRRKDWANSDLFKNNVLHKFAIVDEADGCNQKSLHQQQQK